MSIFWQDGQLAWAPVLSIVYLAILLLGLDIAWRLTHLGGRQLLMTGAMVAVVGLLAIGLTLG